jgi:hypothetical protein
LVAFAARQALKVIAAVVALAACVGAAGAASDRDPGSERHAQISARIQEILSLGGPYSAELLGPLAELIELYHEGDDDDLAAVAIQRALQVVRVNNGLHSLDQVALLEQLIRIEEARGNHAAAWDREQDLLRLVRRYPDDLRTVPVLREVAARRMAVLGRYLRGERPPEVVLGCFYETWPQREDANCEAGSRKTVVRGLLAEAQGNYSAAIATLLRNGLYGGDEVRELELELLRGIDFVRTTYDSHPRRDDLVLVPYMTRATMWEPWRSRAQPLLELAAWDLPQGATEAADEERADLGPHDARIDDTYHRGQQSLRRLYAYGVASEGPPLAQADAAVQLADWDLLYSRHGAAVEGYQLAHDVLRQLGMPRESIDRLFAPALPVVLPAFQPNPLARDERRQATGWLDVAFAITKYGRGRDIEILDAANATDDSRDRLVTLIMTSRFRPRPIAGRFDGTSRVRVRYYVYDAP